MSSESQHSGTAVQTLSEFVIYQIECETLGTFTALMDFVTSPTDTDQRDRPVLVIELIIISVLILSRPRLEISERVTGGWSARVIPILLTVKPCHSGEAGCAHRSPHRKYDPTKLVRERGLRRDPLVVVVMARRREAGMIVKLVRNLESY